MIVFQMALAGGETKLKLKATPFVKWAGGKSQLLQQYRKFVPGRFGTYFEPFVGGGAVFFSLQPERAVLADLNEELINAYFAVRDNVEELISSLRRRRLNDRDYYYKVRGQDPSRLTRVQRASRLIFLNKSCYNGLYRVNRKGKFNVPFGNFKTPPSLFDEKNLRNISELLREAKIYCGSFEKTLAGAQRGDFVYIDPPYHPLNGTSSFTSYTEGSFSKEDQRKLADEFRKLDGRGCKVMLSNSDTPLIRGLYEDDYRVETVLATRAINCNGNSRKAISELVIMNY